MGQIKQRGATMSQLAYRMRRFNSVEQRCTDCGAFTTEPFRVCAKCRDEKYVPLASWCSKHGPKFGACFACSMEAR